jgi:hypothetical protein
MKDRVCSFVYLFICGLFKDTDSVSHLCVCVSVCVWGGLLCVGVLVICVLVFTVFLYCFVYVYLFLSVTSVRTTATE